MLFGKAIGFFEKQTQAKKPDTDTETDTDTDTDTDKKYPPFIPPGGKGLGHSPSPEQDLFFCHMAFALGEQRAVDDRPYDAKSFSHIP